MSNKEENWEQYTVQKNEVTLKDDFEQYTVEGVGRNKSNAMGYGLLGGAGLAAVGLGKVALDPFFKNAVFNKHEVTPFRQQFDIPKSVSPADFPQQIRTRMSEAEGKTNLSLLQSKSNIKDIQRAVSDFDNFVLKTPISEAADTVMKNYSGWQEGGWKPYGELVKNIETQLQDKPIQLSTKNFLDNVINKSAKTLEERGLVNEANGIKKIIKVYKSGKTLITNPNGQSIDVNKPLSFSDAKAIVSNLRNNNVKGSRVLTQNWSEFMERDPAMAQVPEAVNQLREGNKNYVPFKNAEREYYRLTKTGEFNKGNVVNYLKKYVMNRAEGAAKGVEDFLGYLGKGSKTVKGIEGLAGQAEGLKTLGGIREKLRGRIPEIQINAENTGIQAQQVKNEFLKWLQKAQEISSTKKGLSKAMGRRINVAKWGALAGIGKGLGTGFGRGMMSIANPYMMVGGLSGVADIYESSKKPFIEGLTEMLERASGTRLMREEDLIA